MLKYLVMILGLLIPNATPQPVLGTQEIGVNISQVSIMRPLEIPSVKNLPILSLANYSFSPIGSYSNDYDPGQCTWGAASMKGDIPNWGNANMWDDNALLAGYTVSQVPIVGAVAQTDRGGYGHVAVVTGVGEGTVTITEMNYDGLGIGSTRSSTVPTDSYRYIYI